MKESIAAKLGRCYELAAKFQIEHRQFTLVHGRVTSPFDGSPHPVIDHAWLEADGISYDAVLDRYMPLELFNAVFEPERLFTYPWRAAAEKILATEHFGPWDYSDRAGAAG